LTFKHIYSIRKREFYECIYFKIGAELHDHCKSLERLG